MESYCLMSMEFQFWGFFLNNFFFFFFLAALGLSYSIWDLVPQPGIKPMCPALQLGVLTTGPSGKSRVSVLQDEKTYGDGWW